MYGKIVIVLVALAAVSAIPFSEYHYDPSAVEDAYDVYSPQEAYELHRITRSLQPGGPGAPNIPGQNGGWAVQPDLRRDENGNTRGNIEVTHKGKDHDFNAGWGKVIRGPNKAQPTFHVGGTYRW